MSGMSCFSSHLSTAVLMTLLDVIGLGLMDTCHQHSCSHCKLATSIFYLCIPCVVSYIATIPPSPVSISSLFLFFLAYPLLVLTANQLRFLNSTFAKMFPPPFCTSCSSGKMVQTGGGRLAMPQNSQRTSASDLGDHTQPPEPTSANNLQRNKHIQLLEVNPLPMVDLPRKDAATC